MAQAIAKAKIVAIQEHKLTATRMEEISSQLARRGLKWLGSPALVAEKGWGQLRRSTRLPGRTRRLD